MSTDSWPAFIDATRAVLAAADRGLAFDKLHVVGDVSDAVDQVRRAEHRALRAEGRDGLVRCKGLWLRDQGNMILEQWRAFEDLRHSAPKTARAWAIKEHAMSLWHYLSRTRAERAWRRWYIRAIRSRPESVEQVARTIKTHLWGILNAVVLQATTATPRASTAASSW